MNINVFLLFLSFVFLHIERESGGYIKLGIRRNGLKVYLSFFLWWSSCGEYFLFYGLKDFMLFLILAWRTWLLRVRDIFLSSSTRSTGFGSVCHEPCPKTNFSYYLFPLTGRSPHFRFGVPANHLASLFFPLARRSVRATICHPRIPFFIHQVAKYKHLFLTVILWRFATVNSNTRIVVILFLSSQWDITWNLPEVVGTVEEVHCSRRRLLRRGVEFHVCTINKSAHTKKVWKLI